MTMQRNPEHQLPQADQPLKNSDEALLAREALVRLVQHFYSFPSAEITPQQQSEATRRFFRALEVYSSLSVTVAQQGIREEDREMLIMGGLKDEALIDQSDPVRAHKEYKIIHGNFTTNNFRNR